MLDLAVELVVPCGERAVVAEVGDARINYRLGWLGPWAGAEGGGLARGSLWMEEETVVTKGRRQANPRWKGPGAAEEEEPVSASEAAIGAPPATETKGTE